MGKNSIELAIDQQERLHNPSSNIAEDLESIYGVDAELTIGFPLGVERLFESMARENTIIVIGVALGDEGKGRIVDNKLEDLLSQVSYAYVVRYQGGNNAGHSLEKGDIKIALHQVPSGVLYPEVVGIMDRGMVIHPEDLQTEIEMIESKVGDLREKLYLSPDAILVTDLERAEEVLNRTKQKKAQGGTGRGIGPAYAHHYDRLGLNISDLMRNDWRKILGAQYDRYTIEFEAFGMSLQDIEVPDYRETLQNKTAQKRTVGNKKEFLDRLEESRTWIKKRGLVKNTYVLHQEAYTDSHRGILFEGAQSTGLHAWLGTRPDVTASDTSAHGIIGGTGYWLPHQIQDRVGVFKIPYTSSVGERHMPTEISLPKDLVDLPADPSEDEKRAAFIRETAHEYGTTTGRPRDILNLDLPMLMYNCRISGIEVLAGTHLDIARKGEKIKVCTHYTDRKGNVIPYQPGLMYQNNVIPQYVELPGWDGEVTRTATSFEDLPLEAKQFLAFIQKRTGYPIVAATTGPARENLIQFEGYTE